MRHVARGCDDCGQTGYDGRLVLAELLLLDQEPLGQAILARRDVHKLEEAAFECGIIGRWQRACQAVEQGLTSPGEVPRVPGLSGPSLGMVIKNEGSRTQVSSARHSFVQTNKTQYASALTTSPPLIEPSAW